MPLFPSLGDNPHLADVAKSWPKGIGPLLAYHDAILRGESELSIAERELIAAYVSGLNACQFCFGAHKIYAKVFGVEEGLIDALIADPATAPVEDKLRPVLAYVKKLTTLPSRLVEADAQAVYRAGWSEAGLYDAVQVCALFNFMNRIIEGTGVSFDYAANPPSDEELKARRTRSYTDFGRALGVVEAR